MGGLLTLQRILFLVPFPPRLDGADGGSRAMAQLLTGLAARHRVALLCLRSIHEPPVDGELRARCEIVEEVYRPTPGRSLMQRWLWRSRLVAGMLRGRPMWATACAVPTYAARVREFAQAWQPDLVQMEYHIMAQYASVLDSCPGPRVLSEYEPGTSAALERILTARGLARAMHYLDALAWKRFERETIKQVQCVVVFTERDRQTLVSLTEDTPTVRIPLGTVLPQHQLDPVGGHPLSLLFVGNFGHQPNVDAARYLICEILPRVQPRFPEMLTYVVGVDPPQQLRHLSSDRVLVTGHVPDVTPYLDRAAVVVAPLWRGGGMRVKVLEALAAGKAVVASPLAVEGLDLVATEPCVVAENAEQFGEAIVHLLSDPDRRALLAARARAWARSHLDCEPRIRAYEALYESLLKHPRSPRSVSIPC